MKFTKCTAFTLTLIMVISSFICPASAVGAGLQADYVALSVERLAPSELAFQNRITRLRL